MPIGPAEARDLTRVRELSMLSGSGFDPEAELVRTWARLWVARPSPGADAVGFALTGYGRALLDAVIGDATAAGARLLLLEVRAGNAPALALYRSAGFFEHGVRRAYYSDNGEDAVEMRLTLIPESPHPETPT
jgi:ribosomal-protein-alanine N-acetyltransferase